MAKYECNVCGYVFDGAKEGVSWDELPDDWECPVCGAGKEEFTLIESSLAQPISAESDAQSPEYLQQWKRQSDELETLMADIHQMAESGESIIEPMRSKQAVISWDDILIKGAQLSKLPLNKEEAVDMTTVIGPTAKQPLILSSPVYITHMSFGALSREVKIALARGSAEAKTAMCSGEGGILPESLDAAYKYIYEYVPNEYSLNDESLQSVDAVEIKIGQSAKPGMGGHLPAAKVTAEIGQVRGFPQGQDIISPARYKDISNKQDLKKKVSWLREKTHGKPIGIKIAAGHIEADLEVALYAAPDFITIDGRPGATAAAPKYIKAATSVPSIFALYRARKFLDERGVKDVSLVITGGLRVSSDFAKALALGADAVAIGTAALIACGCQQYKICQTGRCPVGITTQDPELRSRLNIDLSAKRLVNYLQASNQELQAFARLTGNSCIHALSLHDLCTTNIEIASFTEIPHV